MALQIRRGTDVQRQSVVLAAGEPFYVTDHETIGITPLWIGDGTTQGGVAAEGASNIDDLLDVTVTNPQNNDFLRWNTSTGRWQNTPDINSVNLTLSGDIAVNGGDATTTATTFNLINTTATTLNMGGAATTLNMGGTTGTATIRNAALQLTGNTIKASDGATALSLTATSGDVIVGGDLTVTGNDIKSSTGTAVTLSGTNATVNGQLTLGGNVIKSSGGTTVITTSGANTTVNGNLTLGTNTIKASDGTTALTTANTTGETTVATNLVLGGNVIKASTGATAITTSGANVTLAGNATVTGNLIVNGTTTTVNSTNLNITDNMILLNKDESGTGVTAGVAGIEIERGSLANAYFQFNESTDRWEINNGTNWNTLPNQNLDSTASPTFVNLTLTGNATLSGDLAVNGSDITTSSSTGNLYNVGTATVNIGNEATTEVNLGNVGAGRVQIKPATIVGANTTQAVFNTVATTVNAFGAATAVNIGAATGTTTINNAALQLTGNTIKASNATTAITLNTAGDVIVAGDLTVTGNDIKSSSATAITLSGTDVTIAGDIRINGNDIKSSTGSSAITLNGTNATVNGHLILASNIFKASDNSTVFEIYPTGSNTVSVAVNGSLGASANLTADTIIASAILATQSHDIVLNYDNNGVANSNIIARRQGAADATIRWNETLDKWQFANGSIDATAFYNLVGSDPSTGVVSATTLFGDTIVATGGNLGSNGKTLTLNYDNGTDTADGFVTINRGATGANVSIKWNESTDRWQFSNDGTTYYNMLLSTDIVSNLDGLTDVVITSPTTNQLLKYNGTNWVNSTVTSALDDLTDVVITSAATGQVLAYNGTNWVNTNTVSGNLTVNSLYASDVVIDNTIIKGTSANTFTSTSQQAFGAGVPISTYNAIKHTWRIVRGTTIQMVETMTFHDGTTAYQTVFGDVSSGSNLINFAADISGGNMRILVTPTSATSTVVTCDYTLFKI